MLLFRILLLINKFKESDFPEGVVSRLFQKQMGLLINLFLICYFFGLQLSLGLEELVAKL